MDHFYVMLMLTSVVLNLVMVWKLRIMKKHDTVLYRFCQIRREIMKIFRDRGFEMPKHDYLAMRQLLDFVNATIHNFDAFKASVFDVRALRKMIETCRKKGAPLNDKVLVPKDPEALKIYEQTWHAATAAFYAYTPFIRSESALRLLFRVILAWARFFCRGNKQLVEEFRWAITHLQHA